MGETSRSEGAWVICPAGGDRPVELVRVIEAWESVGDEELVDGCVPMDGSIRSFDEAGREWCEGRGGVFTGYSSVNQFVMDVFQFDPMRGCWHVFGGETRQALWPVAMDDLHELMEMGDSWAEALARILAAIPRRERGRALLRVPRGLRPQFSRWCRAVVESGGLDECLIRGTRSFREVVRECAGEPASSLAVGASSGTG